MNQKTQKMPYFQPLPLATPRVQKNKSFAPLLSKNGLFLLPIALMHENIFTHAFPPDRQSTT